MHLMNRKNQEKQRRFEELEKWNNERLKKLEDARSKSKVNEFIVQFIETHNIVDNHSNRCNPINPGNPNNQNNRYNQINHKTHRNAIHNHENY